MNWTGNNRKIVIVGCEDPTIDGPKLQKLRNCEIWSVNNLFTAFEGVKFDRWFELHHFTRKGSCYFRRGKDRYGSYSSIKEYLEAINSLDIPVYMQRPLAPIEKVIKYPFRQIIRYFKTKYFGCSFTWMLALALYEHLNGQPIKKIAFYGTHLRQHEYYFQRPSLEHFIGRAMGLGIEIELSNSNLLTAPWIYAYKENFNCIDFLYVNVVKELLTMTAVPMSQFFESMYYQDEITV